MPASAPPTPEPSAGPAAPPAAAPPGRLAVLRRPGFALLFAATSVSTLGSAMASIVLLFALLAKGYSPTAAGLVIAAQTAPTIVLLLAGGVAGDRWPRRTVMVGADLLRLASQGTLALLLLRGHPPLAAVMALAGCGGVGNAFYGPAEGGLIPQAAGPEHVAQANSLISLVGSLTTVAGPSLGGLLVAAGGASLAFGLDAASFGISACLLSLMPPLVRAQPAGAPPAGAPPAGTPPAGTQPSFAAELRQGWAEFRRHRWLGLITLQFGLLNLVTFPAFVVLGAASFATVPGGVQAWGLVISASGAGGICGGLLLLRWRPRRSLVVAEGAALAAALPIALLAAQAPAAVVAAGGVVLGLAASVLNVLISTAIQQSVPAAVMSRVSSVIGLVAQGLAPIGFAACGPVAQAVGLRPALGGGALVLVASTAAMLATRDIRDYRSPERRTSTALA